MAYHSHKNPEVTANFAEALLASLAPDGGLWMPDELPHYTPEQTAKLGALPFWECAAELAQHFVDQKIYGALSLPPHEINGTNPHDLSGDIG